MWEEGTLLIRNQAILRRRILWLRANSYSEHLKQPLEKFEHSTFDDQIKRLLRDTLLQMVRIRYQSPNKSTTSSKLRLRSASSGGGVSSQYPAPIQNPQGLKSSRTNETTSTSEGRRSRLATWGYQQNPPPSFSLPEFTEKSDHKTLS